MWCHLQLSELPCCRAETRPTGSVQRSPVATLLGRRTVPERTVKPLSEPLWNARCIDDKEPPPNGSRQGRKHSLSRMHRNCTLAEIDCDSRHRSKSNGESTTAGGTDNSDRVCGRNTATNSRRIDARGGNAKSTLPRECRRHPLRGYRRFPLSGSRHTRSGCSMVSKATD